MRKLVAKIALLVGAVAAADFMIPGAGTQELLLQVGIILFAGTYICLRQ